MNRVAEHGGAPRALPEWTRPRRVSVTAFAAALTATLFAVTAPAEEHLLRGGNGPGPAANGPGPGCNLIPPLASTGTKVDISQFPPPDSLTDPELAGRSVSLSEAGFDSIEDSHQEARCLNRLGGLRNVVVVNITVTCRVAKHGIGACE